MSPQDSGTASARQSTRTPGKRRTVLYAEVGQHATDRSMVPDCSRTRKGEVEFGTGISPLYRHRLFRRGDRRLQLQGAPGLLGRRH
jgi:hypothetical protein